MRTLRNITRGRLEHALKMKERSDVRKKNIVEYFLEFSKHHRPWLKELAFRYKERGEFPMFPISVLPSYYDDIRDKEVAAFAALLIKDDGEFERIREFREILGNSAWDWFKNREFANLSLGTVQNNRTGGVENWKIAKLMDKLWNECHIIDYEIPNFENRWITYKQRCVAEIGCVIRRIAQIQRCSYFDALTYMLEDCCVGQYFYKLRLLLLFLGTGDGFGLNHWEIPKEQLLCPLSPGIRQFLQTWFPEYKRVGDLDDVISLFGFERDCDFFYAFCGYKELQKRNPKGCGKYATRYQTWYELGSKMDKNRWTAVMPKIVF